MRKTRGLAMLLVLALLLGMGCIPAAAQSGSTNIVLWVFADAHARYYQYVSDAYTKLHPGVTFTVELMDYTSLQDRMAVVIAAKRRGRARLGGRGAGFLPPLHERGQDVLRAAGGPAGAGRPVRRDGQGAAGPVRL